VKKRYYQKPVRIKEKVIANVWDHIYGVFTIVGFLISIGFTILSMVNNEKDPTLVRTVYVLTATIFILSFCFLFLVRHYRIRLSQLDEDIVRHNNIVLEQNKLRSAHTTQAETFHTISHYFRSATNDIDNFLFKASTGNIPDVSEYLLISQKCEYFFINITTCIRSYFNLITSTNNAVTIKIVGKKENNAQGKKEVETWVKTFFRDPVSLKKRRIIEKSYDNKSGRYLAKRNKAFEIILDEKKFFDSHFACDNLPNEKDYTNENRIWANFYTACIVVPISIFIDKDKRNIIGFLTVDNKEGSLNSVANIEFLFAISDLFYSFFAKYIQMINFAAQKYNFDDNNTSEHTRIQRVLDWD